jgi:hypothetical protein
MNFLSHEVTHRKIDVAASALLAIVQRQRRSFLEFHQLRAGLLREHGNMRLLL